MNEITVDYKLLKKQKESLSRIFFSGAFSMKVQDHLAGILNLLDAIQDERPFPNAKGK